MIVGLGSVIYVTRRDAIFGALSCASACVAGIFPPRQALADSGLKILFVGNSFTYFHDMPSLVAEELGGAEASFVGVEGATLAEHLAGGHNGVPLDTVGRIRSGLFDYVVIQEQSRRPILDPDGYVADAGKLCAVCDEAGSVPILLATWAYSGSVGANAIGITVDEMHERLQSAFLLASEETGAYVANVGQAFADAGFADSLYREKKSSDYHHPSKEGSRLAARVVAEAISALENGRFSEHSGSVTIKSRVKGPAVNPSTRFLFTIIFDDGSDSARHELADGETWTVDGIAFGTSYTVETQDGNGYIGIVGNGHGRLVKSRPTQTVFADHIRRCGAFQVSVRGSGERKPLVRVKVTCGETVVVDETTRVVSGSRIFSDIPSGSRYEVCRIRDDKQVLDVERICGVVKSGDTTVVLV